MRGVLARFQKANPDIKIGFMDTFAKSADCCPKKKAMRISRIAYKHNSDKGLEALLLHEKAHFAVPNHSESFKAELERIGGDDKAIVRVRKYVLICPVCKNSYLLNKLRRKVLCFCDKCRDRGKEVNMVWYKYDASQEGLR